MVDKLKVQPHDPVGPHPFASHNGDDSKVVPFTSDAQKRTRIYVERGKNGCTAETDIFGYGLLACYNVAILVQHFQNQGFRYRKASVFAKTGLQAAFVGPQICFAKLP